MNRLGKLGGSVVCSVGLLGALDTQNHTHRVLFVILFLVGLPYAAIRSSDTA